MEIAEILVYVGLTVSFIASLTVYIHFEKLHEYKKGFLDGVEHYSKLVDEALHQTNQFNKEAEETGKDIRVELESIKPLDKEE